jgi:hypothetical protein
MAATGVSERESDEKGRVLRSIRRRRKSAATGSRDLIYDTARHDQIAGLWLPPLRALK